MRYHVPRDGFVWHSDIGPKKRVPVAAWVMLLAAGCFAAGIWSAKVWSPSGSLASSASVAEPAVAALAAAKPLQPRVWTEPTMGLPAAVGGDVERPQAPPAAVIAAPPVKLINPDADEASIDPSMVTPQAEPNRPKAVRPRATRPESAPRQEWPAPTAPQAGSQGSFGYSALRQHLFDRAP